MGVSLDLRRAHAHKRFGDITAILTWVNDVRALVLAPSLRRDAGWYIVEESAAYLWGVDHFDPVISRPAMEHAVQQSYLACDMLGLEPSKQNRARVISIITGLLPDLIGMPSSPPLESVGGAYGQMILSADGKPMAGQDLRHEDRGVQYG